MIDNSNVDNDDDDSLITNDDDNEREAHLQDYINSAGLLPDGVINPRQLIIATLTMSKET